MGAINYGDYYGATVNCGANLIVSENYVETLTVKPFILSVNVRYEQSYEAETEKEIKNIVKTSLQ
ncbi:hypothetical protein C806_04157 [Lachnospiraceae bacterium 3-1]|nr:hypothetical protein C806_04157 [Lachnospiraceae bacterium 3-1]